jgi:hypothetical protein
MINIYSYVYLEGKREVHYITTVAVETWNTYKIIIEDNNYVFNVNDICYEIEWIGKKPHWKKLDFYFGGNDSAYWDMTLFEK